MTGAQGDASVEQTEVGSYFVANYPPFSTWTPDAVAAQARPALDRAPVDVHQGRGVNFVYFGGGTPSFLSTRQLETLVTGINATGAWRGAEEITRRTNWWCRTGHGLSRLLECAA